MPILQTENKEKSSVKFSCTYVIMVAVEVGDRNIVCFFIAVFLPLAPWCFYRNTDPSLNGGGRLSYRHCLRVFIKPLDNF